MRLTCFICACALLALSIGMMAEDKAPAQQKKPTNAPPQAATTKKGTHTTAAARPKRPAAVRQQTPSVQRYTEIQQALADKGHYKGPVNGQWGPESVEALKSFQAEQHLVVDGKLGSLSLIALGLGPQNSAGSKPSEPQTTAQPPGQSQ